MTQALALWVLGPPASGKSTFIATLNGFAVVDQDVELERLMASDGMSLDSTKRTPDEAAAYTRLRGLASDRTWDAVPELRRQRTNIVFETTGDKPALLREEIALGQAAGYASLGIGISCPLAECLARNQRRRRRLPADAIEACWLAFHRFLGEDIYEAAFGKGKFRLLQSDEPSNITNWISAALHAN